MMLNNRIKSKKFVLPGVVLFLAGFMAGSYFFNWLILGGNPFSMGTDSPWIVQGLCFGSVLALTGYLVLSAYNNRHVTINKIILVAVLLLVTVIAGALMGQWLVPAPKSEYSGSSGSGFGIDYQLLVNATIGTTICMISFMLIANLIVKRLIRNWEYV